MPSGSQRKIPILRKTKSQKQREFRRDFNILFGKEDDPGRAESQAGAINNETTAKPADPARDVEEASSPRKSSTDTLNVDEAEESAALSSAEEPIADRDEDSCSARDETENVVPSPSSASGRNETESDAKDEFLEPWDPADRSQTRPVAVPNRQNGKLEDSRGESQRRKSLPTPVSIYSPRSSLLRSHLVHQQQDLSTIASVQVTKESGSITTAVALGSVDEALRIIPTDACDTSLCGLFARNGNGSVGAHVLKIIAMSNRDCPKLDHNAPRVFIPFVTSASEEEIPRDDGGECVEPIMCMDTMLEAWEAESEFVTGCAVIGHTLYGAHAESLFDIVSESATQLETLVFIKASLRGKARLLAQPAIAKAPLRHLILSYNDIDTGGIEAIATALPFLQSLEVLSLEGNSFGSEGMSRVLGAISTMPNVRSLNLASNRFSAAVAKSLADALIGNMRARSQALPRMVDASSDAYSWSVLLSGGGIESLELSNCHIGDDGAIALARYLGEPGCPLRYAGLAWNEITEIGTESIAAALLRNQRLRSIDLEHNRIGTAGAVYIADVLSSQAYPTLDVIKLGGNHIEDEGRRAIFEAVKGRGRLTYSSRRRNSAGDASAALLLCLGDVESERDARTKLGLYGDLVRCSFVRAKSCAYASFSDANALLRAAAELRPILEIRLEEVHIDAVTAQALARTVRHRLDIHAIGFVRCKLDTEASRILAAALADSQSIRTLSLAGTNLSRDAARSIASAFRHGLPSLETLLLSDCSIETHGITAICQSLSTGTEPLKCLDLSGNPFGDEGAERVAAMMDKVYDLERLLVNRCNIDDKGAEALLSAFAGHHHNIGLLTLCGNSFSRKTYTNAQKLAKLLFPRKIVLQRGSGIQCSTGVLSSPQRSVYDVNFSAPRSSVISAALDASFVTEAAPASLLPATQNSDTSSSARLHSAVITEYERVMEGAGSPYIVYWITVTSSDGTKWRVDKRYSDFVRLHRSLERTLCHQETRETESHEPEPDARELPKLPPKKFIGNLQATFVDARMASLGTYLSDLLTDNEAARSSPCVLRFLGFPFEESESDNSANATPCSLM